MVRSAAPLELLDDERPDDERPDDEWPDDEWPDEEWPDEEWPDEEWPDEEWSVGECAAETTSGEESGVVCRSHTVRAGEQCRHAMLADAAVGADTMARVGLDLEDLDTIGWIVRADCWANCSEVAIQGGCEPRWCWTARQA